MKAHSYQVCDQTKLVKYLVKLGREYPEVWVRVRRYEGLEHLFLEVQLPEGYDLEPVDQMAIEFGLRPNSF